MEAKELRIGSMLNTFVGRVLGQRQMVIVDLNHLKHIQEGNKYGYEPIPLTAEWLERCGFEKNCDEWSNYSEDKNVEKSICLDQDDDEIYYSAGEGVRLSVNIEYVHQLQNLYFALTGEELTIKEA